MPTLTAEQRAAQLALTFHSLEGAPGACPFDADALDQWASTVASSGERDAAAFVLGVYNQYAEWRTGRFDLLHALGNWDPDNRAAFAAWVERPFTL